ncbi:MAG: hypothetical protein ACI9XO_004333, partial [Paraglaciecola sp.]
SEFSKPPIIAPLFPIFLLKTTSPMAAPNAV